MVPHEHTTSIAKAKKMLVVFITVFALTSLTNMYKKESYFHIHIFHLTS